jgi:hypothetical protein
MPREASRARHYPAPRLQASLAIVEFRDDLFRGQV